MRKLKKYKVNFTLNGPNGSQPSEIEVEAMNEATAQKKATKKVQKFWTISDIKVQLV